jgi:cell wall-associated NlpC family hydrolase
MFRKIGIRLPRTAESMRQWAHKNAFRVKPGHEQPGDLMFTNSWRGPNAAGHVMVVYNPANHTSWEARKRSAPHGVNIYHYTDFKDNHMYEIWRVGNLADK